MRIPLPLKHHEATTGLFSMDELALVPPLKQSTRTDFVYVELPDGYVGVSVPHHLNSGSLSVLRYQLDYFNLGRTDPKTLAERVEMTAEKLTHQMNELYTLQDAGQLELLAVETLPDFGLWELRARHVQSLAQDLRHSKTSPDSLLHVANPLLDEMEGFTRMHAVYSATNGIEQMRRLRARYDGSLV